MFLHSAPSEVDLDYCVDNGCTPATPEAFEYAHSLDCRAETLQAARLALAKCCKAVSGSDAVHTEARSVKAAKASEAMMKTNPCTISAKTGQAVQATGKALPNCCAVVSGSDAVHTEARSAQAITITSSVNKTAEQAMPEGFKSEVNEKQANNGDTRTSVVDLQCIEASGADLEKTRDTGGSSVKSNAELTALTGYSKKAKAYASPFSFSLNKPMPRTIVATAPAIAPGEVLHCPCKIEELNVQADDGTDYQECETVREAFGLSIQADTGDVSVGLVQVTEPKSQVTDTTAQSLLEQLKVVQQLDDLKISADVVSGTVKVQTVLLKSLTCLDSAQLIPSPSVAFDYDIACQITGKAGPRTNQFDPGKATASPQEGYGDQPWHHGANKHRSNMKEVGTIITTDHVFHPTYVSKDPDELPQYILEESKSITVLEQEKYHSFGCCTHKPVEVVEFLADAVHNAKATWKQNLLKIVAKVQHCLKAVLWIRAD